MLSGYNPVCSACALVLPLNLRLHHTRFYRILLIIKLDSWQIRILKRFIFFYSTAAVVYFVFDIRFRLLSSLRRLRFISILPFHFLAFLLSFLSRASRIGIGTYFLRSLSLAFDFSLLFRFVYKSASLCWPPRHKAQLVSFISHWKFQIRIALALHCKFESAFCSVFLLFSFLNSIRIAYAPCLPFHNFVL